MTRRPSPIVERARVLMVHNRYQQRGGEDAVVEAEIGLLRERGHEVMVYERSNDDIKVMSALPLAANTLWSNRTTRELRDLGHAFRPAIVHVHNTFPLVSPSVYWIARKLQTPVIQTLHNFRLHCPQAMYLRDGKICEDCLGRVPWSAVRHGCYRDSRAQTSIVMGMLMLHRTLGTWDHRVTRYIALNRFCRDKFIAGGLPAERLRIKPNFVDFDAPASSQRAQFLYVGRLSAEKGIRTLAGALADAIHAPFEPLRVAGGGPEVGQLQGLSGVQLLGALSLDEVRNEMARARALVMPSIWYENFPRTLVEAYACGLPVIASRLGALAELVEDGVTGLLFPPGDAQALADRMRWAESHPAEMATMGHAARARYEQLYTPEVNYQQLMAIYDEAVAANAGDRVPLRRQEVA